MYSQTTIIDTIYNRDTNYTYRYVPSTCMYIVYVLYTHMFEGVCFYNYVHLVSGCHRYLTVYTPYYVPVPKFTEQFLIVSLILDLSINVDDFINTYLL